MRDLLSVQAVEVDLRHGHKSREVNREGYRRYMERIA